MHFNSLTLTECLLVDITYRIEYFELQLKAQVFLVGPGTTLKFCALRLLAFRG